MNFTLQNRQRRVRFDLPRLRQVIRDAWPLCEQAMPQKAKRPKEGLPPGEERLPPVEATIIRDAAIGRVHAEFFQDPSPTDVITFPYADCGEILLGAETVAAHALANAHSANREAALCLIHGLLHLRGFNDLVPQERMEMHSVQEKILQKVFPQEGETGAS